MVGSSPGRVNPMPMKLIFAATQVSTRH